MKEETMLKIVNEINDALWDLKFNQCNIDTKEKGWETYYGLDDGLIKYIRKIEKELDQYKNNWEDLKRILEKQLIDCNQCSGQSYYFKYILDIMKELEENN